MDMEELNSILSFIAGELLVLNAALTVGLVYWIASRRR